VIVRIEFTSVQYLLYKEGYRCPACSIIRVSHKYDMYKYGRDFRPRTFARNDYGNANHSQDGDRKIAGPGNKSRPRALGYSSSVSSVVSSLPLLNLANGSVSGLLESSTISVTSRESISEISVSPPSITALPTSS